MREHGYLHAGKTQDMIDGFFQDLQLETPFHMNAIAAQFNVEIHPCQNPFIFEIRFLNAPERHMFSALIAKIYYQAKPMKPDNPHYQCNFPMPKMPIMRPIKAV